VLNELLINQAITKASLWLADFKDAKTRIEKMRQLSRQNDAYLDEDTLNQLYLEGNLNRMMGDFTMAIEVFTDLIDRSRQINDLERVLQANRALAEVIIETHLIESDPGHQTNIEIALSMIVDSIRAGDKISLSLDVATQCLLSTIHALKGSLSKAEEALKLAKSVYHNHPIMQDRVRIILAQARYETARNNFSEALERFDESVVMLEKMKGRWWLARIWLEMGIIHLKRNEPEDIDQAQNFFREALAEFNNMGVNYYSDVTIDKLRQVRNSSRAQAIAHQKVTRELAEAGRVQHTFMPTHSPEIPGYEFSNVLLPANETSGDFFDFIDLGEGKTGIVIADVADKGAGAALYMAMSRTLIRTYAGERHLDPKNVIKEVNRRILSDTQHGIFLTAVFGILDPDQGTFTYVNAGHNPPYLLKTVDNKLTFTHLEKTGTVIGIFEENTWEAQTIDFDPGDVLILYTDGICEAQNQSDEFFGNHRLIKTLKNAFSPSPEAFRNDILEAVQAFTGPTPRLDDITLIVISRKAEKP
jgi:serine phosphatase RsbU (regulator of sigma subunit)